MKIAARELNLLGLTLAVVLLALSYLALEPLFQEWADFRAQREDLLARQAAAQQLLDSRPDVEARLEEFRQGLPTFPAGKKVEAELLQALEQTALFPEVKSEGISTRNTPQGARSQFGAALVLPGTGAEDEP